MATEYVEAVNKHTKEKVRVPKSFLKLFPEALTETPSNRSKATDAKTTDKKEA